MKNPAIVVLLPVLLVCLAVTGCDLLDADAPKVLSSFPTDSTTDASTSDQISIIFSKSMDPATTEAAFEILPVVAGTFHWPVPTTLTFIPSPGLAPNTNYTFTVETGATDTEGHALARRYSVSFRTGATD